MSISDENLDLNSMSFLGAIDALGDSLYVLLGTCESWGVDANLAFEEIHRSNMSKFADGKVLLREDGKVLKPDSWTPPDLERVLEGQRALWRPKLRPKAGPQEPAEQADEHETQTGA